MKRNKWHFTLIEAIVVVFIVFILLAMFTGPSCIHDGNRRKLIKCDNNLKQIGIGLLQFEMQRGAAPAFNEDSAATTTDGKLTAANLLQLYASGLVDDLKVFRCPLGAWAPAPADAAASPVTVQGDPDGAKYTSYNLTTCYDAKDPLNKIIAADMPFAKDNVTASAHDPNPTKIKDGPNCLFKDGHVSLPRNLCPQGSSEYDLSPDGNVYRVDGGAGKGKDTCILGVER